ncbi:uncharacterized protein PRCAT00001962001 [Priceomyces carsonii]|uniref:uncharacterized protein n=1 Tax=Priceomyces carsonii TaxID=28549 RepID=UPI002ED89B66|nr:unnamed protein product [Priceomyces carsonii]
MDQMLTNKVNDMTSNLRCISPESKNSSEDLEIPNRVASPSSSSSSVVNKAQISKKKSQNVRACDACAIRKVKCEAKRPCHHCLTNNLKCTQLRARKKSGPKKLHQKTIDSINHISDAKDSPHLPQRPPLSNTSSTNTVPLEHSDNGFTDYAISPTVLIETLALMNDEPIVLELMKPLTVQSLLMNSVNLMDYLSATFRGSMSNEITYSMDHSDSLSISKLLVIVTLSLLILVNLEKLNILKFSLFALKHRNENLTNKDYWQDLENSLKLKITDLLAAIDRNLVFPSSNACGNEHQTYYNLSISAIHLYVYYQILRMDPFDSEMRDQQKLIHLRKAITYFQLINFPQKNELGIIQLFELYEYLYTIERFRIFFSSNVTILNNSSQLMLSEMKNMNFKILNEFNKNVLFEVFKTLTKDHVFENDRVQRIAKLNAVHMSKFSFAENNLAYSKYNDVKFKLYDITNNEPHTEILKQIILFKLSLIDQSELSRESIKMEWMNIVMQLNNLINPQSEILQIHVSNYQMLPHLIQILLAIVELEGDSSFENNDLAIYTGKIARFFPFFVAINKVIRSNRRLNEWFLRNSSQAARNRNLQLSEPQLEQFGNEENDNLVDTLLMELDHQTQLALNTHNGNNFNGIGLHEKNNPEASSSSANNLTNNLVSGFASPRAEDVLMTNSSMLPTTNFPPFHNALSITTPSTSAITKKEEDQGYPSLALSESTKNLCNLFSQITDDMAASASNSFSNLLQLGTSEHEDVKNNYSSVQ